MAAISSSVDLALTPSKKTPTSICQRFRYAAQDGGLLGVGQLTGREGLDALADPQLTGAGGAKVLDPLALASGRDEIALAVHLEEIDGRGTPLATRAAPHGEDPRSQHADPEVGQSRHTPIEDVAREPAGRAVVSRSVSHSTSLPGTEPYRRVVVSVTTVTVITAPDSKGPPMSGTAATLPLAAGVWTLNPNHSGVHFTIKHLGLSNVRGRFDRFDATLTIGESLKDVKVTASVDLRSVSTNQPDRDAHLLGSDFFSADAHPTMTFESTGISGNGADYTMRDSSP